MTEPAVASSDATGDAFASSVLKGQAETTLEQEAIDQFINNVRLTGVHGVLGFQQPHVVDAMSCNTHARCTPQLRKKVLAKVEEMEGAGEAIASRTRARRAEPQAAAINEPQTPIEDEDEEQGRRTDESALQIHIQHAKHAKRDIDG